jgi:peptide/nickel transport system permease protein/oligopeptide transport system permease protein
MLVSFFAIGFVVFLAIRLAPGDPALLIAGQGIAPEQIEAIRKEYGLDKPILYQYGVYMASLFQGNLGRSLRGRVPVSEMLMRAIPATLELGLASWLVSSIVGFSLGLLAAVYRNSIADVIIIAFAGLGRGLPEFWFAILLMMVLAVRLHWLPAFGRGGLSHLVLPTLTMSIQLISLMIRISRDSILDTEGMDYVLTAWAKGLRGFIILWKHIVRNALIPIVTVMGLRLASLLGAGMVITETIFNWPGVGNLLLKSVMAQDYPTIQGCMLLIAATFLLVNFAVDMLYLLIDPRIKYS